MEMSTWIMFLELEVLIWRGLLLVQLMIIYNLVSHSCITKFFLFVCYVNPALSESRAL